MQLEFYQSHLINAFPKRKASVSIKLMNNLTVDDRFGWLPTAKVLQFEN
jgi:hypothetical protein